MQEEEKPVSDELPSDLQSSPKKIKQIESEHTDKCRHETDKAKHFHR